MAMATRTVLLFTTLCILFFLSFDAFSASATAVYDPNSDDDLRFLLEEEQEQNDVPQDEPKVVKSEPKTMKEPEPEIDESDVVVLSDGIHFSEFIAKNKYVMVLLYTPGGRGAQNVSPVYAAAATELKGEAVLAKLDATVADGVAKELEYRGFPAMHFFNDGVHLPFLARQMTKDAIVDWVKRKTGPGVYNITTAEDAERILEEEPVVVLGFLDALVGPESEEIAAASKLEENVKFYQTDSSDVAKLFHIDPQVKRPALVFVKKEEEKLIHFEGEFTKSAIAEYVLANKFPLVSNFTLDSAMHVTDHRIMKQVILFTSSKDVDKFIPMLQDAAKDFKGKIVFVFMETDNTRNRPLLHYFGIIEDETTLMGVTLRTEHRKFVLDGDLTLDNIKSFVKDFFEDKLNAFYRSEPIPKKNDGDIKIVVGKNFDEIVLDESKDVLLEIHAPWCGYCVKLEPIYNKLSKHLRGIDSLVIAKMDGSRNEHPRAKSQGYPTIVFFPAGNKSSAPITVYDRTVVGFYKFLKQHASIPFKLQRPASTEKAKASESLKDEL